MCKYEYIHYNNIASLQPQLVCSTKKKKTAAAQYGLDIKSVCAHSEFSMYIYSYMYNCVCNTFNDIFQREIWDCPASSETVGNYMIYYVFWTVTNCVDSVETVRRGKLNSQFVTVRMDFFQIFLHIIILQIHSPK